MILCHIPDDIPAIEPSRGILPPWVENPYALVSWWDMEKFSAGTYYTIGRSLEALTAHYSLQEQAEREWEQDEAKMMKDTLEIVRTKCEQVRLPVSPQLAARLIRELDHGLTKKGFATYVQHILDTIEIEMDQTLFMYVPAARAAFYNRPELFGKEVSDKFPSLQFDIVESGNCYASGRGTAVVFHLMRIMETGVQEFGKKLGVSLANEKNWQVILDGVNKAIKNLPSKGPNTVGLSQAAANLYAVKLAWRNEVMHPNDTYTLEEAENLIRQVKIFMEQLARMV